MDEWLKSRNISNGSTVVKLPECPRCCTPIKFTLRYLNYVKIQLNAIEQIKCKQYGNRKENEKNKKNLLNAIQNHMVANSRKLSQSAIFNCLFNENILASLKQKNSFSANDLLSIQSVWKIYSNLQNLEFKMDEKIRVKMLQDPIAIANLKYELTKIQRLISNDNYAHQRLNELSFESQRIDYLLNFYLLESKVDKASFENNSDLKKVRDLMKILKENLILKIQPFNPVIEQKVKGSFTALKKLTKFELTKQEKKMIHKAMGLTQGHWFKCPNGHTYCITECGGAMEKSTCPDCKEEIGGTNHSLLPSNTLASDMDGAQFAAWSDTANNMGNWDI